jgi:predicted RNase H-like HicB family nuclease
MKNIKAIIEKGTDNLYSVYLPDVAGIYGAGETETEAIENLKTAIDMALEHVKETGDDMYYAPLLEEHKLEYVYDLSGFFKTYNYFDVTAFSKRIGINASLMRRYKMGITKASVSQKTRILAGIHTVANELQTVKF